MTERNVKEFHEGREQLPSFNTCNVFGDNQSEALDTNINLWGEANSLMFDLAVRNLESTERLEGDEYSKWLTMEMNKHFNLTRK